MYFLCILTKMFIIHRCKNINIKPTAKELKVYIQRFEAIERNIATSKGRQSLNKHLGKWTPFVVNNTPQHNTD